MNHKGYKNKTWKQLAKWQKEAATVILKRVGYKDEKVYTELTYQVNDIDGSIFGFLDKKFFSR